MTIPTNPIVRGVLTFIAALCVASPTLPYLSSLSALLMPLGTFLGGALHVQTPATVKP